MECFICCTKYGVGQNNGLHRYPIIALSYAYGCNCRLMYAHNCCLRSVKSCPQCRKCVEPDLHVTTEYDYYYDFALKHLRHNYRNIQIFAIITIIVSLLLLYSMIWYHNIVTRILLIMCIFNCIVLDYILKYWL